MQEGAFLGAAIVSGERFIVTTENGSAVVIGEDEFDGPSEISCLLSDPALLPDIEEAERTHDEVKDWRECLGDHL